MNAEKKTRIVKNIRIEVDLCNGCRACEVICAAFHAPFVAAFLAPKLNPDCTTIIDSFYH